MLPTRTLLHFDLFFFFGVLPTLRHESKHKLQATTPRLGSFSFICFSFCPFILGSPLLMRGSKDCGLREWEAANARFMKATRAYETIAVGKKKKPPQAPTAATSAKPKPRASAARSRASGSRRK